MFSLIWHVGNNYLFVCDRHWDIGCLCDRIRNISSFRKMKAVYSTSMPKLNSSLFLRTPNHIKFTKEGIVSISITKKKGKNHTDRIIVSVRDTGAGIHPEILPRLFSKFVTRGDTGTGLGLFISKNIVEAHGGSIGGENNRKGATFVFSLP